MAPRSSLVVLVLLPALCCGSHVVLAQSSYKPVTDVLSGRTGETSAATASFKPLGAKAQGASGSGDPSTVPGMRLCPSADEAANTLVGGNTLSLTVSNAQFTKGVCYGTNAQWGIVDSWTPGHAFSSIFTQKALVLSSGYAGESEDTINDSDSYSLNLGGVGDAGLDSIVAPRSTYDAAVLEFDITSVSDGLLVFQYLFASEEYNEWVGSSFNDVFALWVSSSNGTRDVALLPYSSTEVAINNVNLFSFSQYYNDNDLSPRPSVTPPPSPNATQYDGFTDLLNTEAYPVTKGKTYHLKVAIADVGDHVYDSNIFLAGSSLSVSTPPIATITGGPYTLPCPGQVTLDASASAVTTTGAGIDTYKWELVSNDGQGYTLTYFGEKQTLTAAPNDNIPDGSYDVSLTVTDTQGLSATAHTTLTALACYVGTNTPPVALTTGPYELIVCKGAGTVTLDASPSYDPDTGDSVASYSWTITSNSGFQLGLTGQTATVSVDQGLNAGNTYKVQLLISDTKKASSGTTTSLKVTQSSSTSCQTPPPHPPPVANAGGPYTIGCTNTIFLNASASTVAPGYTLVYSWVISTASGYSYTFPDTTASTTPFSLASTGLPAGTTYNIKLVVYDNTFLYSTAASLLYTPSECEGQVDSPPVADFQYAPYTICAKSSSFVILDGLASYDPDFGDSIQGYNWKVSAGEFSIQNPSVTETMAQSAKPAVADGNFNGPATWQLYYWQLDAEYTEYTVELTVVDSFGKTGYNSTTLTVLPSDDALCQSPPPVADAAGPYSLSCNSSVYLVGALSTLPEGSTVTYNWTLVDGNSSKLISISTWPYTEVSMASLGVPVGSGPYIVVLNVTNDEGESSVANSTLTVPSICFNDTKVTDDPHFVGAHGTHFDFNGNLGESYCLVTDKGVHVNAKLKGYTSAATVGSTVNAAGKGTRSWIGELGLIWVDPQTLEQHKIHLVSRGGKGNRKGSGFLSAASFDGRSMSIPSNPGIVLNEGGATLTFLGTKTKRAFDVDRFQLLIKGKIHMTLEILPASPLYQLPNDSEVHFDVHIHQLKASSGVHGVLGQTYRSTPSQFLKAAKYQALSKLLGEPIKADGASGYGFLDGIVEEYASSSILQPDCKRSTFE